MHKSIFVHLFTFALFTTAFEVGAQPIQTDQNLPVGVGIKLGHFKEAVGTDKSPFIVRIPQQDKSAEDVEKENYERSEKRVLDRNTTYYTGATAYITFGMLIVALLQGGLFFWQLQMMKKTLKDSENASQAAELGASAAKESADIAKRSMIASDRAYLHHSGIAFISHPTQETGHIFWRFHPFWTNRGNTPTRSLRLYIKYELLDNPMPADYAFQFEFPSIQMPFTLAPSGTVESAAMDFSGDDLNAVKAGQKHLYIWGVASYKSVFEETGEHITKFCVQAVNITGDPLKEYNKDQPLGISFAGHGNHNCSDEDCFL